MNPEHAPSAGDESPRLFSHRPVSRRLRIAGCVFGSAGAAFLVFCMIRAPQLGLENIVEETHSLLEMAEVGIWLAVVVCWALGSLRQRVMRSMLLLQWIGFLALLLGMRELDLQVILNTDNIHQLGIDPAYAMHWKTRWLLDPDVPVLVKLVWIALLGSVVLALLVPFGLARYPWPTRLLKFERFPWTLAGGFGLLACAVLLDAKMEEGTHISGVTFELIEESLEAMGALLFVAWSAWLGFGKPNMHIGAP